MAECVATLARLKKPPAVSIHSKKEEPKPQISPAPGLVARRAKNNPKASPKVAPRSPPPRSDVESATLLSKPPEVPRAKPRRASIRTERNRADANRGSILECASAMDQSLTSHQSSERCHEGKRARLSSP